MRQFEEIKELISQGEIEQAIEELKVVLDESANQSDEAYYLLGNAYRKMGNWQMALNNYLAAVDINPGSPAAEAKEILMDILNFYNKDMYNQ